MFFEKEKYDEIFERISRLSKADEIEVHFRGDRSNYIRISNSRLHQNGVVNNVVLHLRTAKKDRVIRIATNDFSPDAIRDFIKKADTLLDCQSPNPFFPGFPRDAEKFESNVNGDSCVPYEVLIDEGYAIVDLCRKNRMDAFALLSSGKTFSYIRNSHGVEKFSDTSDVLGDLVVMGGDESRGYAFNSAPGSAGIDFRALAQEAIEKCRISGNPGEIIPGEYPVVFEPYAVAGLLFHFIYKMFKGDLFEEQRSPASGRLNQKMFSDMLTVTDKPDGPLAYPFDAEGIVKKTMPLIECGVVKNVCYDAMTAKKYRRKPTGHSWGNLFWGSYGESVPVNIIMHNGCSSVENMINSIDRGIYVTRVHYVNVADPMTITLTGLTREGTFLIENGTISRPIKTARFTQNMIEAFNNLEEISAETKFIMNDAFYGDRFPFGYQVPTVKISSFRFTM